MDSLTMHLVIVESPNKIKKISKYLGPDYQVVATVGHFRDLPRSRGLGVSFDEEAGRVDPHYEVHPDKADVLRKLKAAARDAETIYLATDPDREGEAIAWHIIDALKLPPHRYLRATFQAITKDAVSSAIRSAGPINMHLVNAQQSRRVLDRVVGWAVSPVCSKGTGNPAAKSAGRVQSVALRILAEREKEILSFHKERYYDIAVTFCPGPQNDPPYEAFTAQLVNWRGSQVRKEHSIRTEEQVQEIRHYLATQPCGVFLSSIEEKLVRPPAPYTTMTAQVDFRTKFKTSAKASMDILQRLFEAGLITYHRTDSTTINPDTIALIRSAIEVLYGSEMVPAAPHVYKSKANAQEGHEAIHPTNLQVMTQVATGLTDANLWRHYELIWKRTVASQMAAGRNMVSELVIAHGSVTDGPEHEVMSRVRGSMMVFPGFRILYAVNDVEGGKDDPTKVGADDDDDEGEGTGVPPLPHNQPLTVQESAAKECETRPPPRYSDASLTKAMERNGVGRPSTYAAIHQTIEARGYAHVNSKSGKYEVTPLGMALIDFLVPSYAGDFIEIDYTKEVEGSLDAVAMGTLDWQVFTQQVSRKVVDLSKRCGLPYDPLKGEVGGGPIREPDPHAQPCPLCGDKMVRVQTPKYGFFACIKGKSACGGLRDLNNSPILPLVADPAAEPCPLCGKAMARQKPRDPTREDYYRCMDKKCEGRRGLNQKPFGKAALRKDIQCPLCAKPMKELTNKTTGKVFYLCEDSSRQRMPCFGARDEQGEATVVPAPPEIRCPIVSCGKPMVHMLYGKKGPYYRCVSKSCNGRRNA